ncbi:uncharacterized protein [Coffea arabica]|uniref:Uncharacterized protein isoform X2 n=1 Tax=Coffea arabica TaxID=13443 RepID=A0ABM4VP81_COFAR
MPSITCSVAKGIFVCFPFVHCLANRLFSYVNPALKQNCIQNTRSSSSTWGENDLRRCIFNYYKVNPKFVKFQNDCSVYHLLEEVFVNQGAAGDFSSNFENDHRTSAEEQDMETAARCARGKGRSNYVDDNADVEVIGAKEEKGKKGKGKRKSGDCSSSSPMSTTSGSVTDRYLRALDTIESLVSRKKSSSMSVSVSSPTKYRSGRDG